MAKRRTRSSYYLKTEQCPVCGEDVERCVMKHGSHEVSTDEWLVPVCKARHGFEGNYTINFRPRFCGNCYYCTTSSDDTLTFSREWVPAFDQDKPRREKVLESYFAMLDPEQFSLHHGFRKIYDSPAYVSMAAGEQAAIRKTLLDVLSSKISKLQATLSRAGEMPLAEEVLAGYFGNPRDDAACTTLYAVERRVHLACLSRQCDLESNALEFDEDPESYGSFTAKLDKLLRARGTQLEACFLFRLGMNFIHSTTFQHDDASKRAFFARSYDFLRLSEQYETHEINRRAPFADEDTLRLQLRDHPDMMSPIRRNPHYIYYLIVKLQHELGLELDERIYRKLRIGFEKMRFKPDFEFQKLEPLFRKIERPDKVLAAAEQTSETAQRETGAPETVSASSEAEQPVEEAEVEPGAKPEPARPARKVRIPPLIESLEVGTRLYLQPISEDEKELRTETVVYGWFPNRFIISSTPKDVRALPFLYVDSEWYARYFNKGNAYGFKTVLKQMDSGTCSCIFLTYPTKVDTKSFRKTPRIETLLIGEIAPRVEAGSEAAAASPCLLRDLSGGGCKVLADTGFEVGDRFLLSFILPDGSPIRSIECEARNVRKGPEKFTIGGQFVYKGTAELSLLTRFFEQRLVSEFEP